ncbi:MAG TPA: hypothetical protein VGL48_17220 [Acidimicrobiales bacterium]
MSEAVVPRAVARLRGPVTEAVLPYVLARVVVLGTLALAHFIVDRTHPSTAGVAFRVHQGLLGWDAGWYETIARVGYGPLGHQSLRFFPAVPLLTHAVAWLPGVGDGPALIVVANVAAFAATVLLFVLVRRETGDAGTARRAIWFLSLAPAAFVLVMGYAESTLLCFALACFLALRPSPARPAGPAAPAARPNFALAALCAFAAALTRPVGVVLVLVVATELVRWWIRLDRAERVVGLVATAAPVVALAAFLAWAQHVVGDLWAPLRVQLESSHHGGWADPFVTLVHDARGVLHHHVGTALHVPWVILAAVLLVVCWRTLPASYTVFAAGTMALAVAGSNLDSFERYALSAFPLTIAAALLSRGPRLERVVLVLLPAALAGYALLAFLNISVP